jgi:hypothetical protein
LANRFFVAFSGAPRWPLQRPAHCAHDSPDMTRVIRHPRHSLDYLRDSRQSPQVGVEPVRPRAFTQRRRYLLQLFCLQAWCPSGPTRAAQGFRPTTFPLRKPPADALPTHAQLASHRRQSLANAKQSRRPLPPLLKPLKVSARPHPTATTTVHAHARCLS